MADQSRTASMRASASAPPETSSKSHSLHSNHRAEVVALQHGKLESSLPGHCHAQNCKGRAQRFNFCDEHYEQFKFGLIKKNGEPAGDYEKKIEQYHTYRGAHLPQQHGAQTARKAA